jgi:GT2 family glycosyltransferase
LAQDCVSVVVVNWNGKYLMGDCLDSLEKQTYSPTEIIVVDNGSTDGSLQWLEARYPRVRVVNLPENRGFAGGCNAGIEAASGSLIALLNNDAVADPGWLEALVEVIRGRPDVGMVASKMILRHQPTVVDSTGISIDATGVAWDRRVGQSAETEEQVEEIFGPCAGAALYRHELFTDIGGFDDDFFMYLEDVDLAWRARLAGWRCVYAPSALVMHAHSASAVEDSPFQLFHLARNHVWTVVKNYPAPDVFWHLPAIVLFNFLSSWGAVIQPRPEATTSAARLATLRGKLAALRRLPDFLTKRRQVQNRCRVPSWRVARDFRPIAWLPDPGGFRSMRNRIQDQSVSRSDLDR